MVMKKKKSLGFVARFVRHFAKEEKKEQGKLQFYLEMVKEDPICANHRLKLAEIYYKRGEKKKAVSESLLAAEIFCNSGYYRKGLAIYKRLLKEQPWLEHVKLKIAKIYREMGFFEEALSQYSELYQDYNSMGLGRKASEIAGFINDLDPRKLDADEARNLAPKDSENSLKSQIVNENGQQTILALPMGDKEESFFDLAAALESEDFGRPG